MNGLNPEMFLDWARLVYLCLDDAAYKHYENIFQLFENRQYKLYAFHVGNNRYEYIDGSTHLYVHKSIRK